MRAKLVDPRRGIVPLVMPLVLAPVCGAERRPLSPAGLWQAMDDNTKQPTGWF